jgi:hypothetical protein
MRGKWFWRRSTLANRRSGPNIGRVEERLVTMKITVNMDWKIDCTPDEARAFFGLPDVKPMQEALLKDMQQHLSSHLQAVMDPEAMVKTWLPATLKGFEQLQSIFLSQMTWPRARTNDIGPAREALQACSASMR